MPIRDRCTDYRLENKRARVLGRISHSEIRTLCRPCEPLLLAPCETRRGESIFESRRETMLRCGTKALLPSSLANFRISRVKRLSGSSGFIT